LLPTTATLVGDHAPRLPEEIMSSAPSLTFLKRRRARPSTESAQDVRHIEIVAPDQLSTALLLEYAAPLFPAEHVSGTSWIVRLQPPSTGGKWVLELLSLVERWLESARLPSAKVVYGGRSYLIRSAAEMATGPMH
jgi:hypothetical protein